MHCHVNTSLLFKFISIVLNLSSTPVNVEKRLVFHGRRRGFGLQLQEINIVKGLVRFGFVLVQCSTGRLFPLLSEYG